MCRKRRYLGIFFFLTDFPDGSIARGGGGAGRFGTVRGGGLMGALWSAQHQQKLRATTEVINVLQTHVFTAPSG